MAQNDYQTFGDSGTDGVNKLSLADYTADNDRVYGNGYTTKVIRSQLHNKALQQTSKMSAAVAQFLANNGQDALDTDSFSTLATKLGAVSTFVKIDTIASLRAMTSTPSTVYVTGYTTANDNAFGSNFFKWNPTSTVADNGGTIIKLTGTLTGRYELQYSGAVDVKWFGADATGVADSTAAIQATINSSDNIYIPKGNYSISGTLSITNGQHVHGDGAQLTIINEKNGSVNAFSLSGAIWAELSNLRINYVVTPAVGTVAIYTSASLSHIHDIETYNSYNGIEVTSGAAQFFDSIQLANYVGAGMYIHDVNDVYVSHFIFNAGNATNGANGGIYLLNKTEAINFTDGDILNGVYAINTQAASNSIGVRPAYNRFLNVYFDSSAQNPANLGILVESEFIGCWFSGGRTSNGYYGVILFNTDSIGFTNCEFFNNGAGGLLIGTGAIRTTVVGSKFESNSVTTGLAAAHGIFVVKNVTDFTITNCIAHNGLYSGVQGYGIFLDTGTNNFTIANNNLSGNGTGPLLDASGNVNKTITGNIGYTLATTNQNMLINASVSVKGALVGAKSAISNATVGASTLTAGQMLTGNILRSGSTAAYTDTTDTASAIIASIPNAVIGVGYDLTIANTVAYTETIAAGTGVTISGTATIAASSSRKFVVTIASISTPAVTLTNVCSGGL